LSKREDADLAALLARKAGEDATAVREFAANSEISDGIIGFHAQQAIEKWLKAAMALHGIREARIHDLGRLLQILEKEGVSLPENASRLDELTIYAVPLRYDDLLDAEPLDRDDIEQLIGGVEEWVARVLRSDD
jgi:HEPN domain-containing protein